MVKDKLSFAQQVCIKRTGLAMQRAGMLYPGARVGVAVSGGVDSWVMLEVLRRRQRIVPFPFEIMALHINPGFDPHNHGALTDYLAHYGVPGHIEVTNHGLEAHSPINRKRSACFYCAMLRRTRLFQLCQQYKLTHLAFGHNADDLVVTFFMNMMQNGRVDGMNMMEPFFQGELIVIRPMLLVEKSDIIKAAKRWGLSVWDNPCPSAGITRRNDFDETIKSVYGQKKIWRTNMFNALRKWQLNKAEEKQCSLSSDNNA